ncbi:alpha/beta fold hydrolase [Blastococcus montanus]|uniref:alpha/beta fold hydrolase n=1 Tax=Blastococcus montanus TaxID=3144973 RepID=UPI003207BADD
MAHFLLVHGSWLGGWMWDGVARELRRRGHSSVAPTLSGGTLSEHIAEVTALLDGAPDTILVAHSYAGMVAAGVVDGGTDSVRMVVFLDAFVPTPGCSAFDLLPAIREPLESGASAAGSDAAPPLPLSMFGITDPAAAADIGARMRPWPLATHREASPGWPGGVPAVYIQLAGGSFFDGVAAELEDAGWRVERLPLQHLAPITDPVPVTAALLRTADETQEVPA